MGPIRSATSDAGSGPRKQRKVVTLQEKVELLDMHLPFQDKSSIRTIVKTEKKRKFIKSLLWLATDLKTLHFL